MHTISEQALRRQAGLLTIKELAEKLGCPYRWFHYQMEAGRVLKPTTRISTGRRRFYTVFEIETVKAQIEAVK